MRIGVVNDLLIAVEALRRVLREAPEHEIAWVARDGSEAVECCAKETPDLILMDLIMPVMDGVEASRRIMAATPCAILVVTATVHGNASKVFEAMGHGALDAVNTPVLGGDKVATGGQDLLRKIATIGRLIGKSARRAAAAPLPAAPVPARPVPPLVAIGSSAGGPKALAAVLGALTAGFAGGVVVIQHVDPQFAPGLVEWLNGQTPLLVRGAPSGGRVEPGVVHVAVSDDHLVMAPDLTLQYTPEPRECPYRPSVDAFFNTVARHWPARSVAVLLTGMGRDGAEGLMSLRRAGWHTVAQDQETSTVYGMPKAAADIGAAVEILPLGKIAPALSERVGARRVAKRGA